MYDGSVKPVEDVLVGDMVMGPDSTPRRVLNLTRGNGQLLRVVPTKGQPWVCSANHILALHCGAKNRRSMVKMTAKSFQTLSKRSQRDYTLYRADTTTFEACEQVTEPWLLGYWLGDGVSNLEQGVRISTGDPEVVTEARLIAKRNGHSLTKHPCKGGTTECSFYHFSSGGSSGGWNRNPLLNAFKSLGLQRNKHVPLIYKTASVSARQELLAGLLDSDGYVHHGNASGTAEFTNKDQRLANDVAYIARSLGLAAYVSESVRQTCWTKQPNRYFKVSISGDLTRIPTRISRKKAPLRKSPKNVLHTGFSVEEAGYGDYFGFEVDSDNLFLLDDFTVVHNCYSIWLEQLAEFNPRLYTGSESPKQKDEAKAAFTEGDCRLLIISLRAGAGLDGLQNVCRTVVFGELDWSPGVLEQCIGRVYRDGQAEPVMAYYLIAEDGADPIMSDVLGVKRGQIEGVRDPDAELIERLEGDVGNMKRLAEEYLRRNGVAIERGPIPEIVL